MKTVTGGEPLELPGTIAAVRATMAPEQAAEFGREVEHEPAAELPAAPRPTRYRSPSTPECTA